MTTEKKKVLFVDDDPGVLDGLRRMLRSMRNEWETTFVLSGREALDVFGLGDIDVIVSDVRMPGMTGFQLLEEVRSRRPHTIRLALSGQAAKGDIQNCVGPVHQFLSKPCRADTLKIVLKRVCALGDVLESDRIRDMITAMEALPSLPWLYDSFMEQLREPPFSIKAVADIVAQDLGMSMRILQLVSSSFFVTPVRVSDPAHETLFLGLDIIEGLARSACAFVRCASPVGKNFSLMEICDHGRTVAGFAKLIAEAEGASQETADGVYVAGLMHDVGKAIFATQLPGEYDKVLSLVKDQGLSESDAEKQVFQATHAEAGGYLLGLWGLPDAAVNAAACHHRLADAPEEPFPTSAVVHAADVFAHELVPSETNLPLPQLDEVYLAAAGLAGRVSAWRDECCQPTKQETGT